MHGTMMRTYRRRCGPVHPMRGYVCNAFIGEKTTTAGRAGDQGYVLMGDGSTDSHTSLGTPS